MLDIRSVHIFRFMLVIAIFLIGGCDSGTTDISTSSEPLRPLTLAKTPSLEVLENGQSIVIDVISGGWDKAELLWDVSTKDLDAPGTLSSNSGTSVVYTAPDFGEGIVILAVAGMLGESRGTGQLELVIRAAPFATVNASALNVRTGPGVEYERIGTITESERYRITGKNSTDSWWQIELSNDSGWVSGDFVTVSHTEDVPIISISALASKTPCDSDCLIVEQGGEVVVEAEKFTRELPGIEGAAEYQWSLHSDGNACSGIAIQSGPNNGFNAELKTIGPARVYDIQFETAGDYYVYIRGKASGTNEDETVNDSILLGLGQTDSSLAPTLITDTGLGFDGFTANQFTWRSQHNGMETIFSIPESGKYSLYIWMREDGTIIDKIWLSIAALDLNLDVGCGPKETLENNPDIPTASASTTLPIRKVDDFEAANLDAFVINQSALREGNLGNLRFVGPPNVNNGERALAFYFKITTTEPNYSGFGKTQSTGQDWSAYSAICFWMATELSLSETFGITIQIGVSKDAVARYEVPRTYFTDSGTRVHCVPFDDENWSTPENMGDLTSIAHYAFYAGGAIDDRGTIYIDNIYLE
ncbi:MAG: SH3 domain-containing protein [Chloroflexota bacterium]